MNATPNPFQPPAEPSSPTILAQTDWARHVDDRVSFAVTLSERDVKRYFPGPLPSSLFALAIVLLLLLFALQAIAWSLLFFVVVFLMFLFWVRSRSNWRMALRQSPHLLEPISGYIAEQGIFTSSGGCRGFRPLGRSSLHQNDQRLRSAVWRELASDQQAHPLGVVQ